MFIKIPVKITLREEVIKYDELGIDPPTQDGFAVINVSEIEYVVGGSESSTIYLVNGEVLETTYNIDIFSGILDAR